MLNEHHEFNAYANMLDPLEMVKIVRDYIRVERASLLHFIQAEYFLPMVPLHRQQLIQVKSGYDYRRYMSRSDFSLLHSVFRRYAEALQERNSHDQEFLLGFAKAMTEADLLENRIQALLKIQQEAARKEQKGNFTVINPAVPIGTQPPTTNQEG